MPVHATQIALAVTAVTAAVVWLVVVAVRRRAVRADDRLVDELGDRDGDGGGCDGDPIVPGLAAWRAEVDAHPIPELVDVDTAMRHIPEWTDIDTALRATRARRPRRWWWRSGPPRSR